MKRNALQKGLALGLVATTMLAAIPMMGASSSRQLGRMVKDKVNLRVSPTVNSESQGIFENGMQVYVIGSENDWYHIQFGTLTGYIRSDLMEIVEDGEASTSSEQQSSQKDTQTWLKLSDEGEKVATLQNALKEKGYFFGPVTGAFGAMTRTAVMDFQRENNLKVDGIAGTETLELLYLGKLPEEEADNSTASASQSSTTSTSKQTTSSSNSNSSKSSTTSTSKKTTTKASATQKVGGVELADWYSVVESAFPRGGTGTVTDVATGISFNVKRQGGYNHADIEPLTAEDTAKMKKAYGGSWSWARRAAVLTVNGRSFAASMNGMPHGADTVPYNNMQGQTCLHFLNSKTHGSGKVDAAHQAAVKQAYNAYN